MSDVEREKLTIDKVGGLFLQCLAKAPPGTDSKNFEYSVSQPLDDMSTTPTFGQVTTIIQSALSKVSKGSTSVLSPGTIPSDVEMSVNAISSRRNDRYKPPHRRSNDQTNKPSSGKFSIEKATLYRGKGHSESLMEKFGYACLYCRETGIPTAISTGKITPITAGLLL
ncbi:uncharacterized protein VP01_1529g7 [Puccinia sorghi]|uniref:Uncharacterized protein n=1 Tax=Puccinia sorghi TaxID=27349 RepID=A0A0L6VIS3_9BASI|nr:uncharacterized protein VP01_1529g7 [Puccinia sorghi]